MTRVVCSAALLMFAACSQRSDTEDAGTEARAVPMSQTAIARSLRLPRMRTAASRSARIADKVYTVNVSVTLEGTAPRDTTVQARSFDAACTETFVDTAVVRSGTAIQDAVVWVEGPTATVATSELLDRRATIQLRQCRLEPRMQIAAPGSMLQVVMQDSLQADVVVVPPSLGVPVDTVHFTMNGQLMPVRSRADSGGVIGVYVAHLPWARAFVAVAPPASATLSAPDGRARFTLDGAGTTTTIRAWHPSLGIVSAKIALTPSKANYDVMLTYRRK
jgi:hypothetical protein